MSWLIRLNESTLTVTTGDGKIYTPLWNNAIKNINYNVEGFDFVGVRGTYVDRQERKGNQYPILFYFQGDDCIDVAQSFLESSEDKRPWKISHPFYDDLLVQPLNLSLDNSAYNVSKITGVVWETIELSFPEIGINETKEIEIRKSELDLECQNVLSENLKVVPPDLLTGLNDSVIKTGANYNLLIDTESNAALLKDKIRKASSAAQNAISDITGYIKQANDLINFPFLVKQNIVLKVDQMISAFNDFASIFLNEKTSISKQQSYEVQSSMVLSELCKNLINTTSDDYEKRASVTEVYNKLNLAYQSYYTNLDNLDFVQDKTISKDLDYLINFTLASLFNVASDAKQERTFILDKDSNIIVLAHRFYGNKDEGMNEFIKHNEITLSEYLQIPKGRSIKYYV